MDGLPKTKMSRVASVSELRLEWRCAIEENEAVHRWKVPGGLIASPTTILFWALNFAPDYPAIVCCRRLCS